MIGVVENADVDAVIVGIGIDVAVNGIDAVFVNNANVVAGDAIVAKVVVDGGGGGVIFVIVANVVVDYDDDDGDNDDDNDGGGGKCLRSMLRSCSLVMKSNLLAPRGKLLCLARRG